MAAPSMDPEKLDYNLKLLSIFHFIWGGLIGLCSCIPFIHLFIGLMFVLNPEGFADSSSSEPPPAWLGFIFMGIAGIVILLGWTFAIMTILVGRFLRQRKHHLFCVIISGLQCLSIPLGTILGVLSLILLLKDEVRSEFMATTPSSSKKPSIIQ